MAEEEGVKEEQTVETAPNADQPSDGKQTAPPFTAKMVAGPPPEEIYIDGISSLFFRSNVVKFDCYRVVGQDSQGNTENRMVGHRLVMPATALQELIQLLQNVSERQRKAAAEAGTGEAG